MKRLMMPATLLILGLGCGETDPMPTTDDGGDADADAQAGPGVIEPGSCVPMGTTAWADKVGSAELLAANLGSSPVFLGIAGEFVYLQDGVSNDGFGLVWRVPVAGGEVERVLEIYEEATFVLSDAHLYWSTTSDEDAGYGVRWRVELDDTDAIPEEIGAPSPSAPLGIGGDKLFGYEVNRGLYWEQDFESGDIRELAQRDYHEPGAMEVTDEYLYFPNDGFGSESLRRIRLSDGKLEQLSEQVVRAAPPLLLVGGAAYWGSAGSVYETQVDPLGDTRRISYTSDIDWLSNLRTEPMQLSVVDDRIYWVDEDRRVAWARLDGTDCGALLQPPFSSFELSYRLHGAWLYVLHSDRFEPPALYRLALE